MKSTSFNIDKTQPIDKISNPMNKRNKSIRKPMPKPTVAHKLKTERLSNDYSNKQVNEAIEQWHKDPADSTWDWASPSDRDQRLWKIQ